MPRTLFNFFKVLIGCFALGIAGCAIPAGEDSTAGLGSDSGALATDTGITDTAIWSGERMAIATTSVPGDTVVQRAVATAAVAYVGYSAPASLKTATSGSTTWLTDIAGGDGARMRSAIAFYNTYAASLSYCPADPVTDLSTNAPATRTSMVNAFRTSAYSAGSKSSLVDKIATEWWSHAIPSTEQGTLDFMEVLAQCKEFGDRMVKAGGGTSRNYGATGITDIKDVRPGFLGFSPAGCTSATCTHTFVVVTVTKDSTTGAITQITTAESNYSGSTWTNPVGQVPWNRTVTSRTIKSPTLATATFVRPD